MKEKGHSKEKASEAADGGLVSGAGWSSESLRAEVKGKAEVQCWKVPGFTDRLLNENLLNHKWNILLILAKVN